MPPSRIVQMADSPEFVEYSKSKFWCVGCQVPVPHEQRAPGTMRCFDCEVDLQQQQAKKVMDTAISKVASVLAKLDSKGPAGVDPSLLMNSVSEAIGGERELGRTIGEKYLQVIEDPLTSPKEARSWGFGLIKAYQNQAKIDAEKQETLRDLSEEELMSIIRQQAVEMLQKDPEFLRACLAEIGLSVVDSTARTLEQSQG